MCRTLRCQLPSAVLLATATIVVAAYGAERTVDPTFLQSSLAELTELAADVTTPTCHYKPIFGGDSQSQVAKSVARCGLIEVLPGGCTAETTCSQEEQIYVILQGTGQLSYGGEPFPLRRNDFMYLAPGVRRVISNPSEELVQMLVIGYHVPAEKATVSPPTLQIANMDEVKKQVVGNHPPSVLYQLLVGDVDSTRDRIAASRVLTSLFVMEFAPGGTNFPHHHPTEEEIYLVLEGEGEMVAGGGMTGIEGRHRVKAGDAYLFRLNCTVGFYSDASSGSKSRILAARSRYPFPKR